MNSVYHPVPTLWQEINALGLNMRLLQSFLVLTFAGHTLIIILERSGSKSVLDSLLLAFGISRKHTGLLGKGSVKQN